MMLNEGAMYCAFSNLTVMCARHVFVTYLFTARLCPYGARHYVDYHIRPNYAIRAV